MLAFVFAAVLSTSAPSVAATAPGADVATQLEAARRAEADLDYATARALIEAVLANSTTTPTQFLQAHLLAGQLERTAGNDALARDHFLVVLRADPRWTLAADAPPKLAMFFELVRQDVVAEQAAVAAAAAVAPVAPVAPPPATPVAGMVITGLGGAAVVAGAVVGVLGEVQFAQDASTWDARNSGRTMALAGWSTATVGVVLGVVGGALLVSAAPAP
jgi:hypothetical protein